MKRKALVVLIFILLSLVLPAYLPWYVLIALAFLSGLVLRLRPISSFIIFSGLGFLVWFGVANYMNAYAASRLSTKIGILFGNQSATTLLYITGLLGGICAGLGAMSGSLLHQALRRS